MEDLSERVEGLIRAISIVAPRLEVEVRDVSGVSGSVDLWITDPADREPEFCISVTSGWPLVRIICDGYVFDEVEVSHVAQFVSVVLAGLATVQNAGPFSKSVTLTVKIGECFYAASRRRGDGIKEWERVILKR